MLLEDLKDYLGFAVAGNLQIIWEKLVKLMSLQ